MRGYSDSQPSRFTFLNGGLGPGGLGAVSGCGARLTQRIEREKESEIFLLCECRKNNDFKKKSRPTLIKPEMGDQNQKGTPFIPFDFMVPRFQKNPETES